MIEFAGETKQLCKAEQLHFYSVMSESTATDDKPTGRLDHWKTILPFHIEINTYKYVHKLVHFVTAQKTWQKVGVAGDHIHIGQWSSPGKKTISFYPSMGIMVESFHIMS